MKWLLVLVFGCSSSHGGPAVPKPTTGSASVDANTASTGSASSFDAGPAPSVAGDPPEPTAPEVECAFDRSVFCIAGTPTRTALQPSPFEWCPRTQPARSKQTFYKNEPRFSAAETRAHRKTDADACCYAEFSTMACD